MYDINVCAATVSACAGKNAGVCQIDNHRNAISAGALPGFLTTGTGSIACVLTYSNGDPTGCPGYARTTGINFICDPSAGLGSPSTVLEPQPCDYEIVYVRFFSC